MESIALLYNDKATGGTSDKEYRLHVVKEGNGYMVRYENGPRGSMRGSGVKTAFPTTLEEATAVFHREMARKMREGYVPAKGQTPPAAIQLVAPNKNPTRTPYPIVKMLEVKTEREAEALLNNPNFWLQKKENGDFCQIEKRKNGTYVRYNKLGGPVSSIPAEIMYDLKKIDAKTFFLEGELVGVRYIPWQVLELDGEDFSTTIYETRYDALEVLIIPASLKYVEVIPTWKGRQKTVGWKALKNSRAEGGAFKKFGSTTGHVKFKWTKTLSAVVLEKGRHGHNNAVLGLVNEEWGGDKYVEIGSCSLNGKEKEVEVNIGDVIEIEYLYGEASNRLTQPRMLRIRKDVKPVECTLKQIVYREGVG